MSYKSYVLPPAPLPLTLPQSLTLYVGSTSFKVIIDESQYVQNSFKFKYGFRVCKNLGFKIIYNFVQIYSNIFDIQIF